MVMEMFKFIVFLAIFKPGISGEVFPPVGTFFEVFVLIRVFPPYVTLYFYSTMF